MRFEWDDVKNRKNFKKHGIEFETAVLVFEDPHAISDLDCIVDEEEHWQTVGSIGVLVVLVAHLWWDENGKEVIRVISARRATSQEKKNYEAHKKTN